ncbi:WbqC family protein [Patescibacteria group bacterium]
MILTAHQPEYLSWIGFFDRIYQADIFVVLDDVQYQKGGFINRNKIKTSQGWQWLTVPVKEREGRKKINEVAINNQADWAKSHWKAMSCNYSNATHFKEHADFFKGVFDKEWEMIAELDVFLLENIMNLLGIKKRIERSSLMNVTGEATERLVNMCKELGATTYLSGPGGREYMEMEKFKEANINVIFQDFVHPTYPQLFKEKDFIPYLSIVDILFNCGSESLKTILSSKNN